MREVTEKFNVYKYQDAPENIQENIRDYIIQNWDIYDHCLDERLAVLRKVAELLNAELDYCLSCIPDRGEFISFKPNYSTLEYQNLWEVINQEKECPLTGCCYDHDFLDHLTKYTMSDAGLKNACREYVASIHSEYESMCKHEYIKDMCEANDYEFLENGKCY